MLFTYGREIGVFGKTVGIMVLANNAHIYGLFNVLKIGLQIMCGPVKLFESRLTLIRHDK